ASFHSTRTCAVKPRINNVTKELPVNNVATLEKMHTLKLYGMERAFRAIIETTHDKTLSHDELMAHVVESEWDDRRNRKTRRLTRAAGFRTRAAFPEIDFTADRGLDRNALMRLSDCSWITACNNLIISGPTGVGKSYLAQSLGSQACMLGHRTLYFNCGKLSSLSRRSAPKAATSASSAASLARRCSFSTISVSFPSMPRIVFLCSRSSRIA